MGDVFTAVPGDRPRCIRSSMSQYTLQRDTQCSMECMPDLVRAAHVEVVGDDLLQEDPSGHRLVQHVGQRELGLIERELVVVVAEVFVFLGERLRQPAAAI
jgi:hypothetical protein